MKTERNIESIVKIAVAVAMAFSLAQVASADMSEMKMPVEPGYEWDITCGYDGIGGGICAITHTGKDRYALDFNLPGETDSGRSVRAAASGTVTSGWLSGYGNYVDIDHGDGYITRYAHLKYTSTISGYITQGTEIGKCGNTGGSYGSHLHFVLYRKINGLLTPVKPEPMSGYPTFVSGGGPYYSNNYGNTWNFNTPNNFEGWTAHNVQATSVAPDGRYRIDPREYDPYVQSAALSLDANNYNAIEINMASNAPDGNARIYFTTENSPSYSESKMVEFKVSNDGGWQTYTIYMANHNLWQGTITGVRIDPAEKGRASGTDTIGFDWIKVIKTNKKPTIVSQEIDYSVYNLGNTATFKYWIKNPFANDFLNVRLGAQIRTVNPQSNWIDDWNNDKVVTLNSGTYEGQRKYERYFKLPTTTGYYDAHWVILNHNTGTWFDDKEKANAFVIESPPPPVIVDPTPTPTPNPDPTPVPAPQLKPDLIISRAEISEGFFYSTIKNIGDAPSESCLIGFYANDILRIGISTGSLNPGETKRMGLSLLFFDITDGDDEIKSFADYRNVVDEKDETNNVQTIVLEEPPAPTPTPTAIPTITPIPTPELVITGTTIYPAGGRMWVRYNLAVENWAEFPSELFDPAPDLPPCGRNTEASRTWVDIYNADNNRRIYGFCALSSPQQLTSIWFSVEQGASPPPGVYVILKDRETGERYTSNVVLT